MNALKPLRRRQNSDHCRAHSGEGKKSEGKRFFFEKKKQKTFGFLPSTKVATYRARRGLSNSKSFFGSFLHAIALHSFSISIAFRAMMP
jgi:hypothetical protein